MESKKLNYALTNQEVNYLLNALNKIQIVGVDASRELSYMVNKLQNPDNKDELQKEEYEQLKTKFEKKK